MPGPGPYGNKRPKRSRKPKRKLDLGRTPQEAGFAKSQKASGKRVDPSNLRATAKYRAPVLPLPAPSRGSYGRTSVPVPDVDRALVSNAVTGLDLSEQRKATKAITGREGGLTKGEIALKNLEILSYAVPGSAAVKLGSKAPKVLKALKGAEEAAEGASKVSRAARAVSKGGKAKRAAKAADKVERKAVKARVRANRAKMTRAERNRDRVRDVKTRAQAGAQGTAAKVVAGSGGTGAGALGAREAGKKSGGNTSRVLHSAVAPGALPVTGTVPANEGARNLATAPYQLGKATVEEPGAVLKGSVNSARDMLTGFPAAIAQSVTDPKGAAEMMIEDVKRRYGPLAEGDTAEFRRRVQREGGLTPFALDALVVAPPIGRVGGAAARTGKLGKGAERFMNEKRTPILDAQGKEPRSPRNAKSVQMRAGEKVADRIRKRVTQKRAEQGNPVAKVALERGVNVPIRQGRVLRRGVATPKARGRQEMLAEQARGGARTTASGREIPTTRKIISSVPRKHREAIKWALSIGIRSADQARSTEHGIPRRIADIRANRNVDTEYGRLDNIPELERIMASADEIFTPKFGQAIDDLRRIEKRFAVEDPKAGTGRKDPALDIDQAAIRREAQQAEHLIGPRNADPDSPEFEPQAAYTARARQARQQAGLAQPGYFPSELSRRDRKSQKAIGGARFSEQTKAYRGKLFREGIENNDPRLLIRAFDRNVKRRHNWNMVADIMDGNALPWSRDSDGHGKSMPELIRYMIENRIPEESVDFVNPGLMRKNASKEFNPEIPDEGPEASMVGGDAPKIAKAVRDAKQSANASDEYQNMKGWIAYPKEVMDELEASLSTGAIERGMGKSMSEMSKWMLTWNTGWATFQAASNGIQAALSGAGPLDMVRGQILWHRMSEKERDRANAAVGVTQSEQILDSPNMGAAVKGGNAIGGAVQAYQLWREGRTARAMRSANPINWFFRMAQIPENAVRRGVAHSEAKKVALRRMGDNMKATDRAINRLTHVMKMDPKGQVREVMKDPHLLNDVAKGLEDFMGDYTTFTAKERKFLKNVVPFYSWVRFATKFAFFTLPVKRPVTAGILYQLGRLETDEVRELLGDNLPWGLGKLFFEDGKLSIDAYRGNPVLTGITDFREPADVMGFLPPYLQLLTDQVYDRDYFTGQDLTVLGETSGRRLVGAPFEDRVRIFVNSLAGTFTPYRDWSEIAFQGTPQSSDALPWDPRPKKYTSTEGQESARRQEEAYQRNGGAEGVLRKSFLPFLPQPTDDLIETANYLNAETAAEKARLEEIHSDGATGGGGTDEVVDRIRQRISGSTPAQDVVDKIKERMGQ